MVYVPLFRSTIVVGVFVLHLHWHLLGAILWVATGGCRGGSVASLAVLPHPPFGGAKSDEEEDTRQTLSADVVH